MAGHQTGQRPLPPPSGPSSCSDRNGLDERCGASDPTRLADRPLRRGRPPLGSAFAYSLAIVSIWAAMTPALLAYGALLRRTWPGQIRAAAGLLLGYGATALIHVLAFSLLFWPFYGAGQHESLPAMGAHMIVRNVGLNALFFAALVALGWLLHTPLTPAPAPLSSASPEHLQARSRGRVRLVRLTSIRWIRAAGNHAEAVTDDGVVLLDDSLATLDRRLLDKTFARVHRTAIVRLSAVREVRSRGHGDADLVLEGGDLVRLSRRYRAALTSLFPTG